MPVYIACSPSCAARLPAGETAVLRVDGGVEYERSGVAADGASFWRALAALEGGDARCDERWRALRAAVLYYPLRRIGGDARSSIARCIERRVFEQVCARAGEHASYEQLHRQPSAQVTTYFTCLLHEANALACVEDAQIGAACQMLQRRVRIFSAQEKRWREHPIDAAPGGVDALCLLFIEGRQNHYEPLLRRAPALVTHPLRSGDDACTASQGSDDEIDKQRHADAGAAIGIHTHTHTYTHTHTHTHTLMFP